MRDRITDEDVGLPWEYQGPLQPGAKYAVVDPLQRETDLFIKEEFKVLSYRDDGSIIWINDTLFTVWYAGFYMGHHKYSVCNWDFCVPYDTENFRLLQRMHGGGVLDEEYRERAWSWDQELAFIPKIIQIREYSFDGLEATMAHVRHRVSYEQRYENASTKPYDLLRGLIQDKFKDRRQKKLPLAA